MSSWAVYYVYDEGDKEYLESFSDKKDAYDEKDRLQAELDADEDAEGIHVRVIEEP